jgi:Zinc-finger of C2H2 type/Zinc finger, C2H2 type
MRKCCQCNAWKDDDDFSNRQWYKGEGCSRCRECVEGYFCSVCSRQFNNPNELNMHMQVHRPRNVQCPVCHKNTFRSGANAVQHVESGYCSGCRGRDNARQQIYDFAVRQRQMHRYITELPRITWDGSYANDEVPDRPYKCPDCERYFRQLSQLLQHQDNKHGSMPLLLTHH